MFEIASSKWLVMCLGLLQGIPTVERAVINQEKGKYNLLVEG